MKWQQASECPVPPEWFVKALKEIDPLFRVVWGQERYLRHEWAIERKMPPEAYWLAHESLLQDGGPRFVDQPVYDNAQPENDPITGEFVRFKQVGVRKYDLAPEYEWITFCPPDQLSQSLLDRIKKRVWELNHPEEREAEDAAYTASVEKKKHDKISEAVKEGTDEAFLETRKVVQFGHGKTRSEN